jgi:predicted dehydrogenase
MTGEAFTAGPEVLQELGVLPAMPRRRDYRIGCIGSGFIMRDIQLVAYGRAGFVVRAIASRTPAHARAAAELRGVPRVYEDWRDLLADQEIEIVDIAYPPDQQPALVRAALGHGDHIKGLLVQKPLAMTYGEARAVVEECRTAGMTLAVNQNMRYDQSIRALGTLLRRGVLGTPVLATIEMRAVPHWQTFLRAYDRLTLLNMSVHHLDVFRYLFGEPARVFASARPDPRTAFAHRDGICLYILEYEDGLRAAAWDDVWAGPSEDAERDIAIRWRVEGVRGLARGTIGWPDYPDGSPSTIDYTATGLSGWQQPRWDLRWFPDAFAGPMAALMRALEEGGEPEVSGADNLGTMALVEACYRSLDEQRAVAPAEVAG